MGRAVWARVLIGAAAAVCPLAVGAQGPAPPPAAVTPAERDRLVAEADRLRREGRLADAVAAAEKALTAQRELTGPVHGDVAERLFVLVDLHMQREDFAAAGRLVREELDVVTKLFGQDDWRRAKAQARVRYVERVAALTPDQRRRLAEVRRLDQRRGELYAARRHREALPLAHEVLDAYAQLLGDDTAEAPSALNNVAITYHQLGDLARAETFYQRASEARRKLFGERQPDYATDLCNLAMLRSARGDFERAEPLLRQAVAIREAFYGNRGGPTVAAVAELADARARLAGRHEEAGAFPAARAARQNHLDLIAWLHGADAWQTADARLALADVDRLAGLTADQRRRYFEANRRHAEAERLRVEGNTAEALEPCRLALDARRELVGESHRLTADSYVQLAQLLEQTGDFEQAEPAARRAADIYRTALGANHPQAALGLNNVGWVLKIRGDLAGAEALFRQAHQSAAKSLGPGHQNTLLYLQNLIVVRRQQAGQRQAQGDFAGTAAIWHEVALLEGSRYGAAHYLAAEARCEAAKAERLARLSREQHARLAEANQAHEAMTQLVARGKFHEALGPGEQVVRIRREVLGEDDRDYAGALTWLGYLHVNLKDDIRSEPPYRRAIDIYRRLLGDQHPTTVTYLRDAERLYERLGWAWVERGDLGAAKSSFESLATMRTRLYGLVHWRVTDARLALGYVERLARLGPDQRRRLAEAIQAHHRAIALSGEEKYDAARAPCEQALAARTELLGAEDIYTAAALGSLARISYKTGDAARARPMLVRVAEVRKKLLGESHPLYLECLYFLTELHQAAGEYDRAEEHFQQALRLAQQLGPENVASTDHYLDSLTVLLDDQAEGHQGRGDWAAAARVYDKAAYLLTCRYGPTHWRVTAARVEAAYAGAVARFTPDQRRRFDEVNALAEREAALAAEGKVRDALPVAEQVLAIDRELFGDGTARVALRLHTLGERSVAVADFNRAETYFLQALARRREALGGGHPLTADTLQALGDVYRDTLQMARAEPLYQQALAARRSAHGEEHDDVARSLDRLAFILMEKGAYDRAEPLLQKAVDIARKTPGGPYATYLRNLAYVHQELGDPDRAEPLFREAVAVCRTVPGVGPSDLAQGLTDLAAFYRREGEAAKAEPLYREALELQTKELGPDHPLCAGTMLQLGVLYLDRNDLGRAEPLVRRAVEARKTAFGERHPAYASALGNLAWVLTLRGEYDQAEPLHKQRLEAVRIAPGEASQDYANALEALARFYRTRGDAARAVALYRQYLDTVRQTWDRAAGRSERQQMHLAETLRSGLHAYLSVGPRAGVIAEEEYPYVLAWKGLVSDRQRWAREQRQVLRERKGEVANQYAQLQATTARLAALALAAPDPGRQQARQQELRDLTIQKDKLENELARLGSLYRKKSDETPTVGQVRAALPADAALIDFLEYLVEVPPAAGATAPDVESRLLAYVVRRGRPVERVELGLAEPIETAIDRWRQTVGADKPGSGADPAAALRRLVWQPLQKHLDGVQTVLVSPDGALTRFPLAALPGAAPGSYLIEDLAVAIVPVPRQLPALVAGGPERRQPGHLLLVGDVDFGAGADAPPPGSTLRTTGATGAAGASGRLLPIVAPLDGTRAEMAVVEKAFAGRFPGSRVQALTRDQATKTALTRQAPTAQWLHLATHGFFAPPQVRSALSPPADAGNANRGTDLFARQGLAGFHPGLLSGLILAGANRPNEGATDEAVLTALEVEALDLTAELVVLSACETGLGETAGGEGLLGLQRAFQLAGARSVVAGLWSVDDHATQALMTEFYRQLWGEKKSRLEALRQAQLALLRGYNPPTSQQRGVGGTGADVQRRTAARLSPYYWAAFTLSGDWR